MNAKRRHLGPCLAAMLAAILCFYIAAPVAQAAITVDGSATGLEWYDKPLIKLFAPGENGYNSIDNANLRYAVTAGSLEVLILCMGQAPGATDESALGIAFFVGGREIAAYHQNDGASYESANYYCEGAMSVAKRSDGVYNVEGDFTMELRIGCKSQAAFTALENMIVRLFDPSGEPSKEFPAPIRLPEPETTVPTTERTTTTRVTTTKETTTKATTTKITTTKVTTTKATTTKVTTTRATTTKASTTTKTTATQPTSSAAMLMQTPKTTTQALATQPFTQAQPSSSALSSAPQRANPIHLPGGASTEQSPSPSATQGNASENPSMPTQPAETLWDYSTRMLSAPAAAQAGAQGSTKASLDSPRKALLLVCGTILLLTAVAMVLLWLRANSRIRNNDGKSA